jgi:hypothetical protein
LVGKKTTTHMQHDDPTTQLILILDNDLNPFQFVLPDCNPRDALSTRMCGDTAASILQPRSAAGAGLGLAMAARTSCLSRWASYHAEFLSLTWSFCCSKIHPTPITQHAQHDDSVFHLYF